MSQLYCFLIMRFCISVSYFTSLAFLVVCLCFVWFRWLGIKASGAVWLADIYLCGCGALVDMFDIHLCVAASDIFSWLWCLFDIFHAYLCGAPDIYLPCCGAPVDRQLLHSVDIFGFVPSGSPCVAVGAPVWLPSISSPHRE